MSGIVESAGAAENDEEKKRDQQAARSRLVARLLAAAPSLPAFLNDLITTQAVVVAGTEAAAFTVVRGQQSGFVLEVAAHVRPDGATEEVRQQALQAFRELVYPCVQQNRDGAIELAPSDGVDDGQYCLVTLLRDENTVVAVSAVITRCRDAERAQQRLVSMQLVAGYFDLFTLRRKSEQAMQLAGTHQDVLQYATAVGTAENFLNSAANLCNALATRTGAVRVSLGWLKGTGVKVKALSHTENFDKRQQIVQDLQKVMEECGDQDEPVYFNPTPDVGEPSTQNVTREASAYSRTQGGNSVLSVPLRKQGELVGVLTLEWPPKTALPAGAVSGMMVAADVLAPQLEDRYQNDRWLVVKAGRSARHLGELVLGPKHMVAKLVCSLILVAVVVLFAWRPMYHVTAPFAFGATEKRILSSPYEGYLGALGKTFDGKDIRTGAFVKAGDVLVSMDTLDLTMEWHKAKSEALAAANEARKAAAEGKQAESQIAREKQRSSEIQASLYEGRITRASIRAPFDGYITRNEAEDRRGSQVRAGETLFEIAQVDRLRVELSVSERDVQLVKPGQKGEIATTSLPGAKYPFVVERIVPQGTPKEGSNVFTVYGKLDETAKETWRPGMAGEAKVQIEPKPLYYHWTHRFVETVRLKLWTWF